MILGRVEGDRKELEGLPEASSKKVPLISKEDQASSNSLKERTFTRNFKLI